LRAITVGQFLSGGVAAVIAVAGVVDDQHPPGRGGGSQGRRAATQAVVVDLLGVPGGLRQKPLQALHGRVLGVDDRIDDIIIAPAATALVTRGAGASDRRPYSTWRPSLRRSGRSCVRTAPPARPGTETAGRPVRALVACGAQAVG